jgi:hypothetical protein
VTEVETRTITTKIPARLDRLPWARWHWMVVIGLGTVWILDGLHGLADHAQHGDRTGSTASEPAAAPTHPPSRRGVTAAHRPGGSE